MPRVLSPRSRSKSPGSRGKSPIRSGLDISYRQLMDIMHSRSRDVSCGLLCLH